MVKAWKEKVVIPTYEIGKPEKAPMFLEKRVYQGSSGVVYPYQVIEKISDTKTDKTYDAVYLENEYIKVMILPELGGRVQMAYDKIKKRYFIYYNHVIKPALVGLTGPWISGGIEINWPQHHRPSTFLPVDCTIEEFPDGSVTVWVSEMERMFHQKGMAGYTLYPGKAYLEIKGKVYNRTELPQTFLWWANPAVAVNDYYQSVFPPDVNAVFDHGKRDVSTFPIATGTYYKVDYSAGVDISNYKNIPVPTSYMAIQSKYNFVGGYENDTKAGVLHVANHHVSPGKKQWTWGNGDFGRAWDRNLTDHDGPYIELMAGVYTDNQPDFSWLQPYEEKSFKQYFLPYRELGVVKNASKDLLLNVEPAEGGVNVKVFATSKQKLIIVVESYPNGNKSGDPTDRKSMEMTVSPEDIFEKNIPVRFDDFANVTVQLLAGKKVLLEWSPEPKKEKTLPKAAQPAKLPEDIETVEELYLTGLHLEQYRHATYDPRDYYREGLRRDPKDARCNNAMGLWLLRHACFEEAEPYFRTAIERLTERNPNPYDGEAFFNLGVCLKYLNEYDEAYDCFYKSCWNGAWQDAGYLACAQISTRQGRLDDAMDEVEHALARNASNHQARHLKTVLLRLTGQKQKALCLIEESLAKDRFNFGCLWEKYLIGKNDETLQAFTQLMRGEPNNYHEVALDYTAAGLYTDAVKLLETAAAQTPPNAMTWFYQSWCEIKIGKTKGVGPYRKACKIVPEGEFPNRLIDVEVLSCEYSIYSKMTSQYYLGNLWYDKRQYDKAYKAWRLFKRFNDEFPTVWRNLALYFFNKNEEYDGNAMKCMEKAFRLDTTDARMLMELDQLAKRLQRPHVQRMKRLQKYPELIAERDDLYLEEVTLLNQLGRYEEAIQKIDARTFHPWEGGEGKVIAQYQTARSELAKQRMNEGRYEEALTLLGECLEYPEHLGEGRLYGTRENDFYYLIGCCHSALGRTEEALQAWTEATKGSTEPSSAMFYNDQKPDKIFYQGLAQRRLGHEEKAELCFRNLLLYGTHHLEDKVKMDYFAVSLPDMLIWEDDLTRRNLIHCYYLRTLGLLGLGRTDEAGILLEQVAKMDINHQGIRALVTLTEMKDFDASKQKEPKRAGNVSE